MKPTIKKLFTGVCLITVKNSYSFWPMGEIYCNLYSNNETAEVLNSSRWKEIPNKYFGLFSRFDKYTLLRLNTHISKAYPIKRAYDKKVRMNPRKAKVFESEMIKKVLNELNFLNCGFKFDSNFWKESNLKKIGAYSYHNYNITNNHLSYSNEKLFIDKKDGKIKTDLTYRTEEKDFTPSKKFRSLSGIEINHINNKVVLSQICNNKKKSVDLNTALKLHRPDFNYLKSSTILAMWCLVPDDKNPSMQNRMIGLAKDNKTGKLFHWTTDLGEDISVLMRYAKESEKS